MPEMLIPLSAAELRAAVRQARPFDASRLNRILHVDESRGLVEAQARTPWSALAAELRPGDARAAAARTTLPTVGQSIAANAAGPDGRPAVAHLEALALVTPDGELRRVSRRSHPELFALSVGGQELFGVLYSVTLRIASLERAVAEAAALPASGGLHVLVPPERAADYLEQARLLCGEWRVQADTLGVRRILPEDESYLCWARREFAEIRLELAQPAALGAAVRITQVRRALIDAAIERGGSFPIACTPEATREQVEACYPRLRGFLSEKRRIDPAERLANAWYFRLRRLFECEPCEVRWAS